jgi:hypothetical protein
MARKPTDAVQFTLESAERIADVVRAAELATPQGRPLTFDARVPERMPKQVRAATFTGSWAINASKVVTFKYAPTATQTVTNLSWPITHNHTAAENCIVGKEGTSWWLVVPVLQAQTAVFVTQTQQRTFCSGTASQVIVTGVDITAALNTTSCTISVGKTLATSSITVVSATATAVFVQQTATATYLRLRVP